jgi:hypothetical protein
VNLLNDTQGIDSSKLRYEEGKKMKNHVKNKHIPIYCLLSNGIIQIYLKWDVDVVAIPDEVKSDPND